MVFGVERASGFCLRELFNVCKNEFVCCLFTLVVHFRICCILNFVSCFVVCV